MDGVEQDTASTRAIAEHPPAGMSVLLEHIAAVDTMIKEPGDSGHVAQEGSVLHSLNTGVTLQSITTNLETSAAGENCINDVFRDENSPLGSDSATFGLSEILEIVSSSQVGSNFKLPHLNSLIEFYDTGHFLIDKSGMRLPAELLTLGKLLLNRATIIDSSSDMDRSIEYLIRAAQASQGELTVWVEAMYHLFSAHSTRFERYGNVDDINSAVEYQYQMIPFTKERHDIYVIMIAERGSLLLLQYQALGNLDDLQGAIECCYRAWVLIPDGDDNRTRTLDNLGCSYQFRFERLGDLEDMNKAIDCMTHTVHLTPNGHPDMPGRFSNLGTSYLRRFERLGELQDISIAIDYQTQAIHLTPNGHPNMPGRFSNLGNSYKCRFERLGELQDLGKAIDCQTQAIHLTPNGHPDMPSLFSNLGSSYLCQFKRLGKLEDISKAIDYRTQAVHLTPNRHPDMPSRFSSLGTSYKCRFERLGDLKDISKAIDWQIQAVHLTPNGHPDMPSQFSNLGNSYKCRFERLGELEDISKAIDCQAQAIHLTPNGHPNMPGRFNNLGSSYMCRFERLGELEDVSKAINCQTQAIHLTPNGHPDMLGRFSNLGTSYLCRFQRLGELEDISKAINCQTQAVHLTPNGHPDMLGRFSNLGNSYERRFERLGELQDISNAIDYQTHAVHLTPNGHPEMPSRFSNLGNSYERRFKRLGELQDISNAIDCQTQAVHLTPNEHPDMPSLFSNLGSSYLCQFERLGELEDISKAIDCQTQAVHLTPNGHPNEPSLFNNMGTSYLRRFERLGELKDISKAIDCQTQAVHLTPNRHPDMPGRFSNLGNSYARRFERLGELEDISKAIDCQAQAIHLTSDEHAGKPAYLLNFGNSLCSRFLHLKDSRDIAGAIRAYTRTLELLSGTHMLIPTLQHALGQSYRTRGVLFGDPQDIAKALEFFIASACSSTGSPSIRLDAAKSWANLSSIIYPANTLPAHRTAMLLLPELIWLGTTSTRRYECITDVGAVAVEAAAAAISAKKYNLALEWLEQGRSIVWTQTLKLRMPYDVLSSVDPTLAQQLRQVPRELEHASQRTPGAAVVGSGPAALEQATLQHHKLVHQYDQLIARARTLPGFHDFMHPNRTSDLLPAARSGPVIMVNVHADACNALMLVPHSDEIAHVPLPELSKDMVVHLHGLLKISLVESRVRERKLRRAREQPVDHFKIILTTLWHKLVKPVLDFLELKRKPPGDQLPHITWCTTGALSLLPIHAAGDYDSGEDRIFDFAITSYTPTLSALLQSTSQSPDVVPSVVAVSQESTPGFSKLPGTKHELAHIKKHMGSLPYMQLENTQATPEAVLDAMEKYACVHLACHASQDADAPTQSCFHLHGGTLSLEQIARRSLKNKSLAFLSACQTATGDMKLPDEAIHLAAGMLVAGYPSVIATMWSISDCDAPLVADQVYSQILLEGRLDCSRVARALHAATSMLRNEVGEIMFSRWVPYIHIGV